MIRVGVLCYCVVGAYKMDLTTSNDNPKIKKPIMTKSNTYGNNNNNHAKFL